MPVRIIVGAQWGDEGKGKVVDYLSERAELVARYAGGPNAGHTVVVDGKTYILHLLPSGVLRQGKMCVVGNGVVINPEAFFEEVSMLEKNGISVQGRLFVSERAHIITRYHLALESIEEDTVEGGRIGTTRRGIGPAYRDKVARVGIRVGDLTAGEDVRDRIEYMANAIRLASGSPGVLEPPVAGEEIERLRGFGEMLKPLAADVSVVLRDAIKDGKEILAEGAQGTLLDVDHGTYPYVTSSNPVAGGACVGLGIGPTDVEEVVGVAKAYTTRVGRGPFPTELPPDQAQALREAGEEYGATTGRPRRCGWIDSVALRHSARVNGLNSLIVTKLDVLDNLKELKICTGYDIGGLRVETMPASAASLDRCRPCYESFPGWKGPTSSCRAPSDLPREAVGYLGQVSSAVGVPIAMVSVGSSREQMITYA